MYVSRCEGQSRLNHLLMFPPEMSNLYLTIGKHWTKPKLRSVLHNRSFLTSRVFQNASPVCNNTGMFWGDEKPPMDKLPLCSISYITLLGQSDINMDSRSRR